jgi:hypothetical protein
MLFQRQCIGIIEVASHVAGDPGRHRHRAILTADHSPEGRRPAVGEEHHHLDRAVPRRAVDERLLAKPQPLAGVGVADRRHVVDRRPDVTPEWLAQWHVLAGANLERDQPDLVDRFTEVVDKILGRVLQVVPRAFASDRA